MAGDIKVAQDKCWMVAGWVFDSVIELALPHISRDTSELLLEIDESVGEGNLKFIDLCHISVAEKRVLLNALVKGLEEIEIQGSGSFGDPSFYSGFIERFRELIAMLNDEVSSSGGAKTALGRFQEIPKGE